MICKICNREIDRWCSLASHIHRTHKMEVKEYYDKYIEPGVEHKCKVCGKDIPFSGFSGRMLGACALDKKYIGQDIN